MKNRGLKKILLLLSGFIGLIMSFGQYKQTKMTTENSVVTKGYVDSVYVVHDEGHEYSMCKIRYLDVNGKAQRIGNTDMNSFANYTNGETIEIIYPKKYPEKGRVNSFDNLYMGIIGCLFAGLVFIVAGILM